MPASYALINNIRYRYFYWNSDSPSRPILLLHGLASNARIWDKVAPLLAQAGLRLFVPDLRGHGLSDHPDGDYGFETYAADLRSFTDLLSLERPVIVGHSWGAMLALDYAARNPVGPRAPAGIILIDGGIVQLDDFPGATWELLREILSPPRLAGTPLNVFLDRLRSPQDHWHPDEQDMDIILGNFEISPEETIAPHLSFENHMKIVAAMWEFRTYDCFARLRCPALALPAQPPEPASQDDAGYLALKKTGLEKVQQLTPHLQVQWMADSIHDIPLQKPGLLAQKMLEFVEHLS